ncbi:MAG: transcription elongation factor GreA [Eubacteriales bacterium]|jgi:transcription elongation factor GreA|nr:transcription elongation factor GreA [Eubacteriales bacterium]CCY04558.1 transcription elongation factor GreA [Faecalibacterium sp. CAG:1138]
MEKIFLTQKGYDELQERLDYLTGQGRQEMSEKIKLAREYGDLSENAEYDAAKNEQAFMEQEIKEIAEKLRNAEIIDESNLDSKTVSIGSIVKLQDMELDEKVEIKIVGSSEADIMNNKISNESPIGQSLIGKKKGAVVDVNTPSGVLKYKIISISID